MSNDSDTNALRQIAYRRGVLAAMATPRTSKNWNARFVEILSLFGLELIENQDEPWYDEAPPAAPGQLNGWDRCWIGETAERRHDGTSGRRQLYRWPDMKVLAQHATGCAIVMACSTTDARTRIVNYAAEYLREHHTHWYDDTGEINSLFQPDYDRWMDALFNDLKEDPLVDTDPVFILGSY